MIIHEEHLSTWESSVSVISDREPQFISAFWGEFVDSWDEAEIVHCLSYTNRWTDWDGQPAHRIIFDCSSIITIRMIGQAFCHSLISPLQLPFSSEITSISSLLTNYGYVYLWRHCHFALTCALLYILVSKMMRSTHHSGLFWPSSRTSELGQLF